MRRKLVVTVGGVAAGLIVAAPFAVADDVEGGHCEYGDFSVNVEPSCDTDSNSGSELLPALDQLDDFLDDDGRNLGNALDSLGE
jgi:hypothetical protein